MWVLLQKHEKRFNENRWCGEQWPEVFVLQSKVDEEEEKLEEEEEEEKGCLS